MLVAATVLFVWLGVPLLLAPRSLKQTYPDTWMLRLDHGRWFVAGAAAGGIVWFLQHRFHF